jgi:hypothetical protein
MPHRLSPRVPAGHPRFRPEEEVLADLGFAVWARVLRDCAVQNDLRGVVKHVTLLAIAQQMAKGIRLTSSRSRPNQVLPNTSLVKSSRELRIIRSSSDVIVPPLDIAQRQRDWTEGAVACTLYTSTPTSMHSAIRWESSSSVQKKL